MDGQSGKWISYAITAVIVMVVLAIRFRSMGKIRPLKLNRLWVLPAIYSALVAYLYSMFPPEPRGWLFAGLALLLGCVLGWQRGKLMHIAVDPESRALTQKASPAAMLFILVIIVARMGSRMFMGSEVSDGQGLHGNALIVIDCMMAMALGFLSMQRLEMYLRGKKLLEAEVPN